MLVSVVERESVDSLAGNEATFFGSSLLLVVADIVVVVPFMPFRATAHFMESAAFPLFPVSMPLTAFRHALKVF